MKIVVHRGIDQIGGCITEISTDTARVLIDLGQNLPNGEGIVSDDLSNYEAIEKTTQGVDAIFYTHYHGDHLGLFHYVPDNTQQYIGKIAKQVVLCKHRQLSYIKGREQQSTEEIAKLKRMGELSPGQTITVGDIKTTPFFVSHSAYDAYMFLIEANGKKLLNGYVYKENIPIAGMTIRRFRSPNNEIFVVTDTFFKFRYRSKDFSKFRFNGISYNKGRLVNAVIKRLVEDRPQITFSELKQIFPDKIQGSMGVFDLKEKAEEIYERTNKIRYYIKPDEIIQLADNIIISTSTQWNSENIKTFIEQANRENYNIGVE